MVSFEDQSLGQLANRLRSLLDGLPTTWRRNSTRFGRAVLEIRAFCESLMDMAKIHGDNGIAIGFVTANLEICPEFLCPTKKVSEISCYSC